MSSIQEEVGSSEDDFDPAESLVMTVVKWDNANKEEIYRVSYQINSIGKAQKQFLLLIGCMRRKNNLTQILASPLENTSFSTFVLALEYLVELSCLKKIESSLNKSRKADEKMRKKDESDGSGEEELVIFNVAFRTAQMRDSLTSSSIYHGFSFDEKTIFSAKSSKVFASEMLSACALNTALSQSGYFETVAPAIESACVLNIVQDVRGAASSYYSNRRPHAGFLFFNFNLEEFSYLALKYNETAKVIGGKDFRLTDNIFHVNSTHLSISTGMNYPLHRIEDGNNVKLRFEDLAHEEDNHLVVNILRINATRFAFDVDIKYLLGSKRNVSRLVNSKLLSSKGGPAEFRRDKKGNITMHIPISVDVDHTGREDETQEEEDEIEEQDDMDIDPPTVKPLSVEQKAKKKWYLYIN
jgi:hypothetical protein